MACHLLPLKPFPRILPPTPPLWTEGLPCPARASCWFWVSPDPSSGASRSILRAEERARKCHIQGTQADQSAPLPDYSLEREKQWKEEGLGVQHELTLSVLRCALQRGVRTPAPPSPFSLLRVTSLSYQKAVGTRPEQWASTFPVMLA